MRMALRLSRRRLGQTWPNPCVGALIVKNGEILARAVTAPGGRPHAETQALIPLGARARGATLYVTLEPCAHHGQTPPCAQAIIAAGIARVVVACRDPNPQVNGKGIAQLRAAGIEVTEGHCAEEAKILNEGFFSAVIRKRPFVSVKLATSADGKMSYPAGHTGRWITGEPARADGQMLRAQHDAILTGIGTVLADDPLLTCRIPGLERRSPVRIVLDRQGRLPRDSALMKTADAVPLWWFTASSLVIPNPVSGHEEKIPHGVRDDKLEPVLQNIAARGITRLMVEAGPTLTQAFIRQGLADRIYWFRAPFAIGGDLPSITLPESAFQQTSVRALADDQLEIWQPCSPA